MIHTNRRSNDKTNISAFLSELQPVTWTCNSFTPVYDKSCTLNDSSSSLSSHYDNNNTEEENIDWNCVIEQLETKLRTSAEITHSQFDDSNQRRLPSEIPEKYHFRPITHHESTGTESISSHDDDNASLHSILPLTKQTLITGEDNQVETNISTFTHQNQYTSTLHELFHELTLCQQKQKILLQKIQQLIKQSKQKSSSSRRPSSSLTFFLPLNDNSKNISSLQHAFQQRKSSFVQQSKKRVNDIYHHHNNKHHHHQRIIPNIKQTNNTYLQERRQNEHNRLCTMIIKHQNRQNAKIYGNFIKNQLCHN
ncbi:unnamed protein product [Adineta steineri]|uniref:Uncharacterized protein n=1 Tax=Adineta steineri TaxID=433720 RepID=A0A814SKW6_9BILA|nr:unnamed protein product [Adineta steineri]CAF4012371.1 unnamed protein product [Adineta steineri]